MLKDNEVFVKALMNPNPLRNQPHPYLRSRGSNADAYIVHKQCCRLFARANISLKLIEKNVGSNPIYDGTIPVEYYSY